MDLDTILYAVIAAVLLGRLWVVFGRRNDDDRRRPNPFIAPVVPPQDLREPQNPKNASPVLSLFQFSKVAPASLAGGLEQIRSRDASFDEKQFLQNVKLTFTLIVENFAKGDMTQIAPLLTPTVLTHFQNALDAYHKSGQTMESKIMAVKDVETASARMDGDQAYIGVRFVSNQENILRDSGGQIIGGEIGKVEEITDLWTFTRDMKSTDTHWLLAETGS